VQPQLGSVLFSCGDWEAGPSADGGDGDPDQDGAPGDGLLSAMTEVAPGLAVTHHVGDLRRLAGDPPDHVRLFLGYAGWGAGQLVEEILRDDWLVAPVSEELIFAADPDEVWELAVRSVGVDPATLPSWGSGGGEAN
jgi:putative AlgH/UPF0301 family transcriptional regulator